MIQDKIFASALLQNRRRFTLLALILVNLAPLFAVFYLDWDVAALIVLYWSENLVIGFYTIVRMLVLSPLGGLPMAAFFLLHFGGFCGAHGMFIVSFLLDDEFKLSTGGDWPFFLVFIELLVDVSRAVLSYAPAAWVWMFAALFVSHGLSFLLNFLLGGEREKVSLRELMGEPYPRIIVMHITVLLGGAAASAMGQPLAMLLVLVGLKLVIDIKLHQRQHDKLATRAAPASTTRETTL